MPLSKKEVGVYDDTRLFFVTDSADDNEEIFETLEDAEEYIEATKFNAPPRIRICIVRNAYKEGGGEWNYDDLSNTFTTVMTNKSPAWDKVVKGYYG